MNAAKDADASVVIVDTAGRLHTQSNLMDELAKVKRVAAKDFPIPFSPPLEDYVLPNVANVIEAARAVTYR